MCQGLEKWEGKGKGKRISQIAKNEKNEELSFRVIQVEDKDTLYGDDYKKETLLC